MTTEEMLLQLIEGQKRTDEHFNKIDKRLDNIEKDISDIKEDIDEMREDVTAAKITASHNGNILEKLTDQLSTLNIVDVKYY